MDKVTHLFDIGKYSTEMCIVLENANLAPELTAKFRKLNEDCKDAMHINGACLHLLKPYTVDRDGCFSDTLERVLSNFNYSEAELLTAKLRLEGAGLCPHHEDLEFGCEPCGEIINKKREETDHG